MFYFNDIFSKDMKVVLEEEVNLLTKANKLYESLNEGENYNLDFVESGYDVVNGNIVLSVLDKSKLDDIKKWLNGKGILKYKDRITKVAFYESYQVQRAATIYKLSINFLRSPYWLKANDDYEVCTDSILNTGNVESYPLIKLEKNTSKKIDITINGVNLIYTFPDNEEYVIIDCQSGNAFYDNLYRNTNLSISFEFPKIKPGINAININQGDSIIKVKRKDAWL